MRSFLVGAVMLMAAARAADLPRAASSIDELRARLEAQLGQPRFSGAAWGVKVESLETGRVLFEHHADRLLSPASNSKLYTAALALDVLGADYRIVTPIFGTVKPDADGTLRGDLVVSGRGDPSWKVRRTGKNFMEIFDPFVAQLRRAGVRRVTGDLVADATYIVGLPNGSGWTADDLNDYYGAEISAITLEENYAELRVRPGGNEGEPGVFEIVQPHTGLVFDNRIVTVTKGRPARLEAQRIFGEPIVHLFGEIPVGAEVQMLDVTVPRPAQWFAAALKARLAEAGIIVEGKPRSRRWPDPPAARAGAVKLGEITSPPLGELIRTLMKPSQNLETDLIFAHVGESLRTRETPPTRTAEQLALAALREFLRKNGLPADDVRFDEGSGLSRNNLTSANATVALLKFMTTHRDAAVFRDALPIAGVDGTLRKRMKETPAEGNVRAKTGTLRWATSLSGYVKSAAGEKLVFSLMLNRSAEQPAGRIASRELDDIAVMLASLTARTQPGVAKAAPDSRD